MTDEKVSDSTFGLTEEQQQRYRPLKIVASAPVPNARGQAIGVLSVSSDEDQDALLSPHGRTLHLELAEVVARVLIDILHRDTD